MERRIPFLIFSVGNVQYHLQTICHRKFRLNGKRPFCQGKFSDFLLKINDTLEFILPSRFAEDFRTLSTQKKIT